MLYVPGFTSEESDSAGLWWALQITYSPQVGDSGTWPGLGTTILTQSQIREFPYFAEEETILGKEATCW
jgi:hypothetical protein